MRTARLPAARVSVATTGCPCPNALWVMVTWVPPHSEQNDRQTDRHL